MAAAYDALLLESARAGDSRALETLLVQAQPDIRRYARKSCALSEDADEAVQAALLAVHRHIGGLRALASFSGWMLAIVKRECMRLGKLSLRFLPGVDIDSDARFARMPAHELRIDVANAIQSLPVAYRDIVLLRDFEELTIDGIAGKLGLTREAVKARLHRARKLLREYLSA
jgi:RNA polymerase sigma factor (sigma-70 family)